MSVTGRVPALASAKSTALAWEFLSRWRRHARIGTAARIVAYPGKLRGPTVTAKAKSLPCTKKTLPETGLRGMELRLIVVVI